MATIKYTINGSFSPFGVELRKDSDTGTLVDSMVVQTSGGLNEFTNILETGLYFVVVYDTAGGRVFDSVNILTTTTTTTLVMTTTTTSPTTTTTTTPLLPTSQFTSEVEVVTPDVRYNFWDSTVDSTDFTSPFDIEISGETVAVTGGGSTLRFIVVTGSSPTTQSEYVSLYNSEGVNIKNTSSLFSMDSSSQDVIIGARAGTSATDEEIFNIKIAPNSTYNIGACSTITVTAVNDT